MIPLTAALELAEIADGEAECQDDWFPDDADEYRLWLEHQDDATADQQDGDRCPACGAVEPCGCIETWAA